jgi:hypothetical protein
MAGQYRAEGATILVVPLVAHLQRAALPLLIVVGLAALGLSWGKVAATISGAKPVAAPERPNAIVWADRVFPDRATLARWLRGRGADYHTWLVKHPEAGGVLEHRKVTVAPRTKPKGAPTAAPAPRPKVAKVAVAAVSTGGGSIARTALLAFLIVLVGVFAVAAALPTPVLFRYPALGRAIAPRRELLFAGAAALGIGILLGDLLA